MPVTQETIQQLQDKVSKLKTDNDDEAAKTAASNQADSEAAQAASKAAQAKNDEIAATAQTSADVNDLKAFIDGLVS